MQRVISSQLFFAVIAFALVAIQVEAMNCFNGDTHVGTLSIEVTSHPLPAFVNDKLNSVSFKLMSDTAGLCDKDDLHYEVTLTTSAGQTGNPLLLGTKKGVFSGGSVSLTDLSITQPTTTMTMASYDEMPSCTDCFSLSIRVSRYNPATDLPAYSVLDVSSSTNGFWITSTDEPYNFQLYEGSELIDCQPSLTITVDGGVCGSTPISFIGRVVDNHNNPYMRDDITITVTTMKKNTNISAPSVSCNDYGEVSFGMIYIHTTGTDYIFNILSTDTSSHSIRSISWNPDQGLDVTDGEYTEAIEAAPPGGFDVQGLPSRGIAGTLSPQGSPGQASNISILEGTEFEWHASLSEFVVRAAYVDINGDIVVGEESPMEISIASPVDTDGTLFGNLSVIPVDGVATFTVSIDKVVTESPYAYVLQVKDSSGLVGYTPLINIFSGLEAGIAFTNVLSKYKVGEIMGSQTGKFVSVNIVDKSGNMFNEHFGRNVFLYLLVGRGSGEDMEFYEDNSLLIGNRYEYIIEYAIFRDIAITKPGIYKLSVRYNYYGETIQTSKQFTVASWDPASIVIDTQPVRTYAGWNFFLTVHLVDECK